MVRRSPASGSRALARRPPRRGGKPSKVKRSGAIPEAASAVSTADGPGITVTGRPSSAAARTASKPGSETTGIPASVTTRTRCPARTASSSVAVRSASLCSW